MRPDIRWRITPQETEKLNKNGNLSFILMIVLALLFLFCVYLFALYDQETRRGTSKNLTSISIPVAKFQRIQTAVPLKDKRIAELPLQKVLKSLKLEGLSFVLAQIGSVNPGDVLYHSSNTLHVHLTQVFKSMRRFSSFENDLDSFSLIPEEKDVISNHDQTSSHYHPSPYSIARMSFNMYVRKKHERI